MRWWIKVSCMATYFAAAYLTPVGTKSFILMAIAFVPWILCVIDDARTQRALREKA